MMSAFDPAVNYVLANEKGLEENKNDPGGITNFGLSLRFLRAIEEPTKYGFFGAIWEEEDVIALTLDKAKLIYHGEFWERASFDKIKDQHICNYIFDMSVNLGIAPAIKCVQRACWAFISDRYQLPDDGILGKETIAYVNVYGENILPVIRAERAGEYRLIVANNPKNKEFLNGWLNRTYKD